MRVLIIDIENMGLDFALRCAEADHDVRLFRLTDKKHPIAKYGDGFKSISLVDEWQPSMPWAKNGLIVLTGNFKFVPELDRFRDLGYKIFAPTTKSAKLEIERGIGMKAMEDAGIELPHYETFADLAGAYRFAKKADCCYVFKPMGDEEDKSLTFVANDPAELVGWLDRQIKRGAKMKGGCMLQEKIDMLCELGVSGWFGPDGFLPNKWQICFEHKKLMDGEIGPATGEAGSICQYTESEKLATEMLLPLVGTLKKMGHRGDFCVGAGIDKNGKAWPFEFTARCGYPAWWLQMAAHKGDPAEWMRDLLDGKDTLQVSHDATIGVVVGQPRYPYGDSPPELVEGNPISGLDDVWDDVHLASVMIGEGPVMESGKIAQGPIYQTTGEYVLCATATGKSIESARKRVYRTIEDVKLPNAIYRTDIGKKVQKILPELRRFGYATELDGGD